MDCLLHDVHVTQNVEKSYREGKKMLKGIIFEMENHGKSRYLRFFFPILEKRF